MSSLITPTFGLTGLAIAAGMSGPLAHAVPPEAGETIENTGSVSYLNTALGTVETIRSNTVASRINAVPDFEITSDQRYVRSPGEAALFSFSINNTGNVDTDVLVNFGDIAGEYNFTRANAFIDVDNNGRIGPGDISLSNGSDIPLSYGGRISVLVDVAVPASADNGQMASATLSVSLMTGGGQRAAVAEVVVNEQAISLEKAASTGEATPGSEIIYTLILRNNSALAVDPEQLYAGLGISVDGVVDERFVVRDAIPLHTNFERIVDAVDFDVVYQMRGAAADEWMSAPPSDAALIDSIGFISDDILPPGSSRDFQFAVTVNDATSGVAIENAAEVLMPASGGGFDPQPSNLVITPVDGAAGRIGFFGTDSFDDPLADTPFDSDVFVELVSGQCNLTSGIDEALITVTTSPENDRETLIATETAPNSGVFRTTALPTGRANPALPGDGVLQGSRQSLATASADCDPAVSDTLSISPAGVVFVSSTNEPVPGALVELVNASGVVIVSDTTDADGMFDITPPDSLDAATAQLRVTPPAGFIAPSARTSFPGFGRTIDPSASYSRPFQVTETGRTLAFDIPIDPDLTGALSVSKAANRQTVRIGELVEYAIEVRNTSPIAIQQAEIEDALPPGLSFVAGTARYNGQNFADPMGAGRRMVFPVGLLPPNSQNTLTYSVQVDATAGDGTATNLASVSGTSLGLGSLIRSNIAAADINIDNDGGVFSRDGVVLGKVFLDCDGDGVQRNGLGGEPGIPGVQLHTQDGLSVVTDSDGRFSLPGLSPTTHVLDIYEPTLPGGSVVANTRAMDAGKGGTRFIPLKAGEIRSEDFAVRAAGTNECSWPIYNDVRMRIESLDQHSLGQPQAIGALQLDRGRGQSFSTDYQNSVETAVFNAGDASRAGLVGANITRIAPSVPLDEIIAAAPPVAAFVDITDGAQLIQRSVSIRVTAPKGLTLSLSRNGGTVDAARIGASKTVGDIQAVEYIAVDLSAGANTLTLTATDSFGNVRSEEAVTITAPGAPARLNIIAPETAIADPSLPVPIVLQVVDAKGHPTAAPIEATLGAGPDTFDARDLSEQRPGLQTQVENGEAIINLIPSAEVGTRTILINSPLGQAEARIRFTPNVAGKPIAVGYAEAVFNFNTGGLDSLPGRLAEDEISLFEDKESGVEGALYLKGRVTKDTLLTLRYDSDKDLDEALFRSVEPDEFYPVYGDQSERGFDARSRGKLFAKAERGSSYVLFGDVAYDAASNAIELGRFQRTLEGARAHIEAGPARIDLYAGETSTGQTVLEIPARGVSGPYDLGFGEVIQNSETVELITRDRNQPDIIIKSETLGRFSAYTLDYFSRSLVFTRPIASRDADLNPVSIRVTFETEDRGGEDYAVYGGEAGFDISDWLTVGARSLTANAPSRDTDKRTVQAAYIDADIGSQGTLQIEVATTKNNVGDSGDAARLSYEQQTETGNFGARIAATSDEFDAPGASVSKGRQEARLYGSSRFRNGANVSAEALYSAAETTDDTRYGAVARYEQSVSDTLRLRAGSRYVKEDRASRDSEDALTVIAGLNWTPERIGGLSLDLEAEQEITDGSASRLGLGADYLVSPKLRAYVQGEYTGSRSGEFGLADDFNDDVTIRAGAEYRWADNISAFTEYRANEGLFDSGVAQGLTANWALSPALNLRARAEYVQPIAGRFQRNTAAGVGFSWEPEENDQIVDGDLEYNAGENGRDSWYASNAYGRRWNDVTLLARNRFATTSGNGETRTRNRLRAGWAHRPETDDALNTLTWYEYELDDQAGVRENRHIWSIGGERKPGAALRYRGRLAGQYYSYTGAGADIDNVALLAQGGIDRDVGKRWNLAANVTGITDGRFDDYTWGVGGEVNYVLSDNALIGIGYNHADLNEREFKRIYRQGVFLRLRIKADQDIWNIFGAAD